MIEKNKAANGDDEYGNQDDSQAEIDKILSGAVDGEQDDSKTQERELIEMMCSKNAIGEAFINGLHFSTLINPHDVKDILKNHNSMIEDLKKLEESNNVAK